MEVICPSNSLLSEFSRIDTTLKTAQKLLSGKDLALRRQPELVIEEHLQTRAGHPLLKK